MRVQILRALVLLVIHIAAAADETSATPESAMPQSPPGVPAAGPDSAPMPDGLDSPVYDAIRQRCALAIDRRACVEAARHPAPASGHREKSP